jgi:hypothetical protein
MSTILSNKFQINGVVSTDKTVLQNINALCDAAASWMTYDIAEARWSVIINQPGSSIASFNDSNIIGGINVSGSGITELYNSGNIEFPHKDLRDQKDYVDLITPEGDRFVNEIDNKLTISTDLINDPIQATYILRSELKQSRVDKIIQFRTDYSKIGLKAGDLIDVTSEMYGYDEKVFRITKLEEDDGEVLAISITALEYDAAVYDDTNLLREVRVKTTGIIPKAANAPVLTSDAVATSLSNSTGSAEYFTPERITQILTAPGGPLYEFLKTTSNITTAGFKEENPGSSIPSFSAGQISVPGSTVCSTFQTYAGAATPPGQLQGTGFSGSPTSILSYDINIPACEILNINLEIPYAQFTLFPRILNVTTNSSAFMVEAANLFTLVVSGTNKYFLEFSPPPGTVPFSGVVNRPYPQWNNPSIPYIPAGNVAFWYIPMSINMYYNDALITSKASTLYTPSVSFQYSGTIPAGVLTFEFTPAPHINPDYQLYHAGHTSLGTLSDLYVTVQTFKET